MVFNPWYLDNNTVTPPWEESPPRLQVEFTTCRCRLWLCPHCARVETIKLRHKLMPVLATFKHVMMLTLTVDPSLFTSPQQAYQYLTTQRCVARTMQDLRRLLNRDGLRYVAVLEFQKHTLMPHYHVLVETDYVPHEALGRLWGKHRPCEAGPPDDSRPSFGFVSYTTYGYQTADVTRAVEYAVKVPEHGYPAWVLNLGGPAGRVRRYATSREFSSVAAAKHRQSAASTKPRTKRKSERTYAERLNGCGSSVHLVTRKEWIDHRTGEVSERLFWASEVSLAREDLEELRPHFELQRGRLVFSGESVDQIIERISILLCKPVMELRRATVRVA